MAKAKNSETITKTVEVDANIAPLLDYMLKKAEVSLSDINKSFIKKWINQHLDLLTESDRKKFLLH